jgi:hypothetical protein
MATPPQSEALLCEGMARAELACKEPPPLVLILCGPCGVGKSSTANLLLGRQFCATQRSAGAVTSECSRERAVDVGGREVHVVDTPGLSDPGVSDAVVLTEIVRGVADAAAAHPNAEFAVLLVMSLAGRVDDAVVESFKALKGAVFGVGMYGQSAVIWTHGDLLAAPQPAEFTEPMTEPASTGLLAFCGECGQKGGGVKFCTACGTSLTISRTPLPAAPPDPASSPGAPLDAYLASAGDEVRAFLSRVKGASVVLSNPEHAFEHARLDPSHLARVVQSAAAVAGPAAHLAPPKRRGKTARRERQLDLAKRGLVGRAVEAPVDGSAVTRGAAVPGIVGMLYRWLYEDGTPVERSA